MLVNGDFLKVVKNMLMRDLMKLTHLIFIRRGCIQAALTWSRQIVVMAVTALKSLDDSDWRIATPAELAAANINPQTGLATDYLNHFNEAVMLLDMVPDMPDCVEDFMEWRPLSYVEHFTASQFAARDLAIAAYEDTDVNVRAEFDALTDMMTVILVQVGKAMGAVQHDSSRARLAVQATAWLRPLVTQVGGVINGLVDEPEATDIDAIMGASA